MQKNQIYLSTIAEEAGDVARKYGLGIEIAEYCTAYNMDEFFAENDAMVRKVIEGVSEKVLHAPFNELFPCAIDPKAKLLARERYLQALALAKEYGAKKVIIHGGYNPFIYYPIWYIDQSIPFWCEFVSMIPDGITVCLENVLEETPNLLLEIVKEVDDPRLRLCLDVGHVNAYSKIPVEQWLSDFAPYLSHFHLHNNQGDADRHHQLNDGSIDMKALLLQADKLCPEASYTLEVMEDLPSVEWLFAENIL